MSSSRPRDLPSAIVIFHGGEDPYNGPVSSNKACRTVITPAPVSNYISSEREAVLSKCMTVKQSLTIKQCHYTTGETDYVFSCGLRVLKSKADGPVVGSYHLLRECHRTLHILLFEEKQ